MADRLARPFPCFPVGRLSKRPEAWSLIRKRTRTSRIAGVKIMAVKASKKNPAIDKPGDSGSCQKLRFRAKLLRPKESGKSEPWTFLKLPIDISAAMPSRGQVSVEGTINNSRFQATLDPDGAGGHWVKVDEKLRKAASAKVG